MIEQTSLRDLQAQQQEWADRQPWERGDGTYALLGVIEEVGELAASLPIKDGYLNEDAQQVIALAMEVGLLAHAVLKARQGIRKNQDHASAAREALEGIGEILEGNFEVPNSDLTEFRDSDDAQDAAGDITIYLLDIFNRRGWDYQGTVETVCEQVFARDWTRYPTNGRDA